MDVLFINSTEKMEIRKEVNGTMLLATKLLQADFVVDILRFYQVDSYMNDYNTFIRDITDKIITLNPKCVSFYTLWPYYHIMLRIAQNVKDRNPKIITILGGPQSSATAYETMKAMDFIDYISTGEGENTIVPLFNALLRKDNEKISDIPGLYYRENKDIYFNHSEIPISNLETLPYWDDRLYIIDENKLQLTCSNYFMPIDAGRGCPFSCTFCSSSLFWKRKYRLKSPERIVNDIKFYNKKFGITSFLFSHDAFTCNNRLVSDVCDKIIESGINITWKCTARIDCINEELILKMKKSGMTHIELGVETGSKRMQKIINKKLDLTKAKNMIKFLISNGIKVALYFMYGFPEETEEDLEKTLNLYFNVVDMGCDYASMSFCKFNAMTSITSKYLNELVLEGNVPLLQRGIFGYKEEYDIILNNKIIFSHFYHLNTKVRNEYQDLYFLGIIYRKYPHAGKLLRSLYKGDNLKFYKDFYNNNIDFFQNDMLHIGKRIKDNSFEMLKNTIKDFDEPFINQILALLKLDYNILKVSDSSENIEIKEVYNFSYIEYKMGLPIQQYSNKKTEILIKKQNGMVKTKVLSITI